MRGHQATYENNFIESVSVEDERCGRGRGFDLRLDT
jgi:hypothetical protein